MVTAKYGRPKRGRCITGKVGHVGCSQDILHHLDQQCSGRTQCSISVLELKSYFSAPCDSDLINYMMTSYKCQHVTSSDEEQCHQFNETTVEGTTGFFPSSLPYNGIIGGRSCPWVVTSLPGQRILLQIFDFTLQPTSTGTGNMDETCAASLVIHEVQMQGSRNGNRQEGAGLGKELCGGRERQRRVHTTSSSTAKIYIQFRPGLQTMPLFLISYAAVGCPSLERPENMRVTVEADIARVVCNFTGEVWYLICKGTNWVGALGNCTEVETPATTDTEVFPWGIVIAVVVGVGIGTVVGLSLLGLVFLCRRCFCPEVTRPEIPPHQPSLTARAVPPMNELIRSATVMAKQGGDPNRQNYSTYQRSPHPYTTSKFSHQVEYHPQGSLASREEHIYESYIYKDGTIRSRKGSASESTGSAYCDVDSSVMGEFPVGQPMRMSMHDHVLTQPSTGAHPVAGSDIDKL